MNLSRTRHRVDFVALVIVLLAFGLRTAWPTLAEFKYDEANVVRHALQIAHEGARPVVGVDSSTSVKNLPLMLYLMALPLRLWADPVAAVLFIGWLNTLAVAVTYRLGKSHFGLTTGRISAFLFAVGGWAVLYGRKVWCRTLPLFTLAFIASLLAVVVREKRWAMVSAFAALAGLIGLQLEGLIFGPFLVLTLVLFPEKVAWRPLLVGLGIFGLLMAPYGIHDALHGWANVRGLLTYAGGETIFSWDALRYAFRLTGSAGMEGMAGVFADNYLAALPKAGWFNDVMHGLLALALIHAVIRLIRGSARDRRLISVLLLWFAIPILSQIRSSSPTQPHYFVLLYPVQFLLIGMMISYAFSRLRKMTGPRLANAAVILPLMVWSAWQVAHVATLFPLMAAHPTTGGYGIPLRYARAAATMVDTSDCPGAVMVLTDGTNPAFEETPAIFDALFHGRPRRFADGALALPVPAGEHVAYLVGPIAPEASPFDPLLLRLDAMPETTSATLRLPDGWRYQSYCRQRADREDLLANLSRLPTDAPFANQVVFTAYDLPETAIAGETSDVWLAWWLRETPPAPVTTQFYVHLRDKDGETLAQLDGNGYPTTNWQAGDLVISRFPLTLPDALPAGAYELRAGMYTLPDVVNVPVVDATGVPLDDGVTLGRVCLQARQHQD